MIQNPKLPSGIGPGTFQYKAVPLAGQHDTNKPILVEWGQFCFKNDEPVRDIKYCITLSCELWWLLLHNDDSLHHRIESIAVLIWWTLPRSVARLHVILLSQLPTDAPCPPTGQLLGTAQTPRDPETCTQICRHIPPASVLILSTADEITGRLVYQHVEETSSPSMIRRSGPAANTLWVLGTAFLVNFANVCILLAKF